jgi:PhnB protein
MFEGHEGKIMHSELHINEKCVIYLVDDFGNRPEGKKMNLLLQLDSEEEVNKLYTDLSKERVIDFQLQKTFWGAHHAIVTDKFGVTWALNYTQQ